MVSKMDEIYILGFDLGASGGRAMLGKLNESEKRIVVEEVYRFPNYIVRIGDSLYWDVLRLWYEVKNGIKLAYKKYGDKIVSIGVDTWGLDFALLDEKGELVGNPHMYRDPRTKGLMEEVFKIVPKEKIYMETGIQFMRINTLYHLYAMVKYGSPQLKIAKYFLMMPDLFHYWLTGGTKLVEYTDATTTQFVNPRTKKWCYDILEALGIPTDIFPEIVEAGTDLGSLSTSVAVELDIPPEKAKDIKIHAPATHDTASAVAAGPMINESAGYISSGTWSLVGIELPEPLINKKAMEYNFTNEGGVFNTIRFLRNVQGMWLVEESRRILRSQGYELTYDEILKQAQAAKPFKALIDPDHPRFVSPINMVEEINKYLEETKQEKPSSIGEYFRIIFDSLALKYRYVFELAMDVSGRKLTHINIFGGGSRNWLLNQITADVTGIPVYAGPDEATSLGNILTQAIGLGIIRSLKDIREYVINSYAPKKFEPNHTKIHDDAYAKFLDILELTPMPLA